MYGSGNRNNLTLLLAPAGTTGGGGSCSIGNMNPNAICSTYKTGAYYAFAGTSMATPHVAGGFAIINQYRRLEGSIDLTPAEIEDALNDSGKVISDAGSGLDFSRIKIYHTILAIDQGGVSTTLNSPANNSINASTNNTFNCSSTDIQLSNLTFYLWNSSNALINQTTYIATSNNFEIGINQTLANGTYSWNCLGDDNNSNSAWASNNYTFKVGGTDVTLNSPANNLFTTSNSMTFNCTLQNTIANLTNVTLQIWNVTNNSLVYNATTNISGANNETTFAYNLTAEDDYDWNCLAYDADSNSILGDSNYTITLDSTNPVVSLESPDDDASESEGSIDFEFNVSDTNDIVNCSLVVDDEIEDTSTSISKGTSESLSLSLNAGSYDWKIRCYDEAGNSDDSAEREITITSSSDDDDDSSDSSGSGGAAAIARNYIATKAEFEKGYSKALKEGDKINFTKNNESHKLELDDATNSSIKIKIYSDVFTLTILLGETEKADLNSDNIYDIAVTYNEYNNLKANITIKSINETIETRQISTTDSNETISSEENSNETMGTGEVMAYLKESFKNMDKKTWITIGIIAGLILLAGIGWFLYHRNDHILGPVFKKKYKKKT